MLREFLSTDTAALHTVVGDDRVAAWLSFDTKSYAETEAMVDSALKRAGQPRRSEYYLAVARAADPSEQAIGFVRLGLAGVAAAKLGYAVGVEHQGRGHASEAAGLVLRFGFEKLLLHRVSAAIGPENEPSLAVAARLGMTYEGRIRHHVVANGQWRDSLLYSVLADEWSRRAGDLAPTRTEGDWEHGAAG